MTWPRRTNGSTGILAALDDDAWRSPSGAPGWSIADVVLHLAQTDEAVAASAGAAAEGGWPADATGVDDAADRMVREQRAEPAVVFARWRAAQQASLSALRDAEPGTRLHVGGGHAQAGHAGHDPPGRALGPRARHHRTARDRLPRHRPAAPHRLAGSQHAALRVLAGGGRAPSGLLPADRAGRRDVDLRSGGRRVGHRRPGRQLLPGRCPSPGAGGRRARSPPAPTDRLALRVLRNYAA